MDGDALTAFYQKILKQPAALRELVDFYRRDEGRRLLSEIPRPERVLLTGMDASYHAGLYASYVLQDDPVICRSPACDHHSRSKVQGGSA
jgi:hypothetical protein